MADLLRVPIKDGAILFAAAGSTGPEAYTGAERIAEAASTFNEVLDTIRAMGEQMSESLSDLEFAEAEASFGISFTGKGRFIVAEASAQASLTVTMKFKGR